MTYVEQHDLATEFPEFKEKIHDLKLKDHHFARVAEEYHDLDKQVRRAEMEIDVMTDEALEDLKKRRLHHKDELYKMLVAAE